MGLAAQASALTRRTEILYEEDIRRLAKGRKGEKKSPKPAAPEMSDGAAILTLLLVAALVVLSSKFGQDQIREFQSVLEQPKPSLEDLERQLVTLNELLEESPNIPADWKIAQRYFPQDVLMELLGISKASLHRYTSEDAKTPDKTAEQLRWLLIQAIDLSGSYNEIGVRNWWTRQRPSFGNKSPLELLKGGKWRATDKHPTAIRDFIQRLNGMGAG